MTRVRKVVWYCIQRSIKAILKRNIQYIKLTKFEFVILPQSSQNFNKSYIYNKDTMTKNVTRINRIMLTDATATCLRSPICHEIFVRNTSISQKVANRRVSVCVVFLGTYKSFYNYTIQLVLLNIFSH